MTAANNGSFEYMRIPLPHGFEVCWAGPNPLETGLCFGSTDGRLLFADEEGRPLRPPGRGSDTGEAINGVARLGSCVGVSTREEVNFWPVDGTPGVVVPYGAHGITTAEDEYFIAPLGLNGILVAQPFGPGARMRAYGAEEAGLYAYRIIMLRSRIGAGVIACATRLGGIAAGEFAAGQDAFDLKTAKPPGLDIVDICPLDPGTDSLAVAALGRDGSLVLIQDVLDNKKSAMTMKFESVQGVAYRILSSHGDVHLLTSKGLYVLGELAGRFLRRELKSGVTTPVRVSPMEAVDANLVGKRWLLVLMSRAVARFDLEAVHQEVLDHLGDAEIQEIQPTDDSERLEWREIQTTTKQLVSSPANAA